MKNRDLYTLVNNAALVKDLKGIKFVVEFNKNLKKAELEVELMDKSKEPTKEYKEYIEKVEELRKKYADKDSKGNPVIVERGQNRVAYSMKEHAAEFEKAVDKLSKSAEFKEVVEAQQKLFDDFIKYQNEDIKLDFNKVSIDDLPKDISVEQFKLIEFMIDY